MAIRINLGGAFDLISTFESKSQMVTSLIAEKMEYLLKKLQQRIRIEKLPEILRANISEPEVVVEGGTVIGSIEWLGGTGYYAINPKPGKGAYRGGMMHGKQIQAHGPIKGREVLVFLGAKDGKKVFAPFVFHPPFPYQNRMEAALNEMRSEIYTGLAETIQGLKTKIRPFG